MKKIENQKISGAKAHDIGEMCGIGLG